MTTAMIWSRQASFATFLALGGLAGMSGTLARADQDKAKAKTFEVETIEDIPYYQGKDADPVKHKLDLYLPKGVKDFPVLFFVHGGAWRMGDKAHLGVYRRF